MAFGCPTQKAEYSQEFDATILKPFKNLKMLHVKVGASVLSRALSRLPKGLVGDDVIAGLDAKDDAAVTQPPPSGHVMIHTVDFFRSFISDSYEFGAIAANHALGVIPAL